jgi:hypothetical protein
MKNLETKNQQPVAATETAVRPGDFKVPAHRAPSVPMGVPEGAVRVDTPAAGDCLFWSVMLSALLRFKGRDDFPALVARLFGVAGDVDCATQLQEVLLPAYRGRVSDIENPDSGAVLYTLMLAFRRRVAQHLQTTTSHHGSIVGDVQDYCDRMAQAGAWGGELEVTAMAELLGVDIVICREGEPPHRVCALLDAPAREVLHIAHVAAGGNDAKSSERNHYVYYARAAECDWAATSSPVLSPEAKQPHGQASEKVESALESAAEDKKIITPQEHLNWDRLISSIAPDSTALQNSLREAFRQFDVSEDKKKHETSISRLNEKIRENQEITISDFQCLGECFRDMKHADLSLYFFERAYKKLTGIDSKKRPNHIDKVVKVIIPWVNFLSALGRQAKESSDGRFNSSAEGVIESGIKELNDLNEALEGDIPKRKQREIVIAGLTKLYRAQANVYSDCGDRKKQEEALSHLYDFVIALIALRGEADAQAQEKASSGPRITGAFLAQLHVRSLRSLNDTNNPSLAAVFSWIMAQRKPQKRFDLFVSALEYATKYRLQVGQAPATETSATGVTSPVAVNLDDKIDDYEKKAGGGLDDSQQSDLEFMRARAAYFRQDYNAAIAISNALMTSQKKNTPAQKDATPQVGIRMKATKYIQCVELLVKATQANLASATDDAPYQAVRTIYEQETNGWQGKGYPYLALHFLDKALRYAEINNRQDEVHQLTQAKRAFIESNLLNGDSIAPNTVRDDINQEYEDCVMRFVEIQSLRLISHANNDIYDFLNKDGDTGIAREQYQKVISLILLMHSLMDQSYQQFTRKGYFPVGETQFPAHAKNHSPRFSPLLHQAENRKSDKKVEGTEKKKRKREHKLLTALIIPELEKHPELFLGFADSKARIEAFMAYCLFVGQKFKKPEPARLVAALVEMLVKAQADDPQFSFSAVVQIESLYAQNENRRVDFESFHDECKQSAGALLGGYAEAELSRPWEAKDTRTPYDPALFKIYALSNYFKHVAISIPDERVNKNKKVGLLRTIEVDRSMRVRWPDRSNTKNKLYNNADFALARDEKTQGLPESEAEVLAYFYSCGLLLEDNGKFYLNDQGLEKAMTLDEFEQQMQAHVEQKAIDDGEAGRATQLQYQPWVNHMLPYLYAEYQVDNGVHHPSEVGYPIANLDLFLWQGLMAVREVINDFVPRATPAPATTVPPSAPDAKSSPALPIDSRPLVFYQAQEGLARSLYLKAYYGMQAAQYFLHCGGEVSEAVAVFNRVIGYLDSQGHQRASVDFSRTCSKWLSWHADEKVGAEFKTKHEDREKKFLPEAPRIKDPTTLLDSFYEIQTLFFDQFIAQAVRCLPVEPSGVIAGIDPSALDKLSMIFRALVIRLYTLFDQLEPKEIADSAASGDSKQLRQKAITEATSPKVSQFFKTNQADIEHIKALAGESKHKKLLRIHCDQESNVEWVARFLIGPLPEKKIETALVIVPIVQRLLDALAAQPELLACSSPERKGEVADVTDTRIPNISGLSSHLKSSGLMSNEHSDHQSSRYSASSSAPGGG